MTASSARAVALSLAAACLLDAQAAGADGTTVQPSPLPAVDSYLSIEGERVPSYDQTSGASNSLILRGQLPLYDLRGRLRFLRIKIPFDTQGPIGAEKGNGDTTLVALLATAPGQSPVWAFGASARLPTASAQALGSGKWSAGPAAGYNAKSTAWRAGFLIQNFFSVAGNGARKPFVRTQLQPLLERGWPSGFYVSTSTMNFSYDWYAGRWDNVPIGLAIGKRLFAGLRGFDVAAQAEKNLAEYRGSPVWSSSLWLKYHFPSVHK
jgi:hypothetical protein